MSFRESLAIDVFSRFGFRTFACEPAVLFSNVAHVSSSKSCAGA